METTVSIPMLGMGIISSVSYLHEMQHIKRDGFYSEKPVEELEGEM